MENTVLISLIASLFCFFMTALGSAMVAFFKEPDRKIMNFMLGFAAGVMIAASFWSLLAPSIEKCEEAGIFPVLVTVPGFIVGAVFMWCSDKVVSFCRRRTDKCETGTSASRIIMLVLSITIHNIPEGLAVGVAFGAVGGDSTESFMCAAVIALGIALQNFPEGAAVSLPMRREGHSRVKSFIVGASSAVVEPIFAAVGAALVTYTEKILPWALSFAAGAMILVAVHELIPECQENNAAHPYFATFGIVAGFAVMMFLDVSLS